MVRTLTLFLGLLTLAGNCWGQRVVSVSGQVLGGDRKMPLESATVSCAVCGLWTLTDEAGHFSLSGMPVGTTEVEVHQLGYRSQWLKLNLTRDTAGVVIVLPEENLKLSEVSITAQRARVSETTSYTIDRAAMEHAQMLNVSDVTALLPGGKSQADLSLMSDARIALRSEGSSEMGNTSFGTAIEVDGIRLATNGLMSMLGASTRTLSPSNIERVEVVTGIPSVEYGDLSNGIVKVETRRGKSPWVVEGTVKPHTRQVAVSKGWQLSEGGVLNVHVERAKSFSNLTLPYTSYDRNGLNLSYSRRFDGRIPLSLRAHLSGNVGGYDSSADPDNYLDTHSEKRDRQLRGNLQMQWQIQRPGITSLEASAAFSVADQKSEERSYTSTASSVVQIHATEAGYYVGMEYDEHPDADIVLSPIGYWYRTSHTDSKPLNVSAHVKYHWNARWGQRLDHQLKAGIDYDLQRNRGRGTYYEDLRTAPTWRASRYDTLPALQALSMYVEEHLSMPFGASSRWSLTAGVREDMTYIAQSTYGRVSAFSPRVSSRWTLWNDESLVVSHLSLHGGWGKSVKLPSFQVLYPSTTYADQLAFAPGTMADGRTFYAYYTQPSSALYNKHLRWQYAHQREWGLELHARGIRLSLSAYGIATHRPYLATSVYRPYTYKYTGQAALEGCPIPSERRTYSIDRETGIVTVSDKSGIEMTQTLAYVERNTFRANTQYVNGSASTRRGVEWVIDLPRISLLHTDIRIDGNWTRYRGIEHTLIAARPNSTLTMANGQPYAYIGYYDGGASMANGSLSRQLNTNLTVTTHLPVVRMILSVKLETTLQHYSRTLQTTAYLPSEENAYLGERTEQLAGNYVLVYPKYYSEWSAPERLIPFESALREAYRNDLPLYQELIKLVERTNTNYYFRGNSVSPYLAGHINLTKEIGDHVSVTFQATNFWNNTRKVRTSQTHSESTLYGSGYIQSFYYGLSAKIKY